jgi:hypothetical protein
MIKSKCFRCNKRKLLSEFYLLPTGLTRSYCKICDIEKAKIWNNNNPEKKKKIRRDYYHRNKEEILKQQRRYYLANREKINERERNRTRKDPIKYARKKRTYVWSKFGGSYELFDNLFKEQNGLCAICGIKFTEKKKPQFDHNSVIMRPRGLLCIPCNTNLPYIENKEFVEKANLYLKKHNEALDKELVR